MEVARFYIGVIEFSGAKRLPRKLKRFWKTMEYFAPRPARGMRSEEAVMQQRARKNFMTAAQPPKRVGLSRTSTTSNSENSTNPKRPLLDLKTRDKSSASRPRSDEHLSISNVDMSSDSEEESIAVRAKDDLVDQLAEQVIKLRQALDHEKTKKAEYKREVVRLQKLSSENNDTIPLQRENIQLAQDLKKVQLENAELSVSAKEMKTIRGILVAKILLQGMSDEDEDSLKRMSTCSLFSKYERLSVMKESSGDVELRLLKDSHAKLTKKYETLRENHEELKAKDETNTSLCDMLRQTLKEAIPERFSESKNDLLREKLENVSAKLEAQSVIRRNHEQLIQDLKDILEIESEDCRYNVLLDEVRELKRTANHFRDQREAMDIAVALRETETNLS